MEQYQQIKETDKLSKASLDMISEKSIDHMNAFFKGVCFYTSIPVTWYFSDVLKYIPKRNYFLNADLYDTTHGIRHILRVMIYAYIIALQYKQDPVPAIIAAAWHDLRRLDDFSDKEHGERGFIFFKQHANSFSNILTLEQIEFVAEAIRYHDHNGYKSDNIYLNILKTADALDRYRLKNEPGWPKAERIPLQEGLKFIPLFRNFTLQTEYSFLKCKDSLQSIRRYVVLLGGVDE